MGECLAIINPKITGFLPNGEALVETRQAVEMLRGPTLPIRMIKECSRDHSCNEILHLQMDLYFV